MPSTRTLLSLLGPLLLLPLLLGTTVSAEPPMTRLVRFGVITDVHFCDKQDDAVGISLNATPRYYTGALSKLEAFVRTMNAEGAHFIIELGDLTDVPQDRTLPPEQRAALTLAALDTASSKLAQFRGPRYPVLGNHETDLLTKEEVWARLPGSTLTLPPGQHYYSFDQNGVHFVVLDADYRADGTPYCGRPGCPGAGYRWFDANVPPAELKWLAADLAAARPPVIVFSHQVLSPLEQVDATYDPLHMIRNAAEVRAILEQSRKVLAVFSGHYHEGGRQQVDGIHYVVLQASAAYGIDADYHAQFATVDIYGSGKTYQVVVTGHGMQKDRVLPVVLP